MALGAADLGGHGQHPGAVEIGGDQRPIGGQLQPGSGLVQHVEGRAADVIGHGQTASLSQRRGVHLHVGAPHLAAVRSQQPQGRIRQDDQRIGPHPGEAVGIVRIVAVDGLFPAHRLRTVGKIPAESVEPGAVPPRRHKHEAQHSDEHQQENQELPQHTPLFRRFLGSVIVIPNVFCRIFSH